MFEPDQHAATQEIRLQKAFGPETDMLSFLASAKLDLTFPHLDSRTGPSTTRALSNRHARKACLRLANHHVSFRNDILAATAFIVRRNATDGLGRCASTLAHIQAPSEIVSFPDPIHDSRSIYPATVGQTSHDPEFSWNAIEIVPPLPGVNDEINFMFRQESLSQSRPIRRWANDHEVRQTRRADRVHPFFKRQDWPTFVGGCIFIRGDTDDQSMPHGTCLVKQPQVVGVQQIKNAFGKYRGQGLSQTKPWPI